MTRNNLGNVLRDSKQVTEAEAEYRAALAEYELLTKQSPTNPDHQNELAGVMVNLASLHLGREEFQDARRLLQEAVPHHTAALKANPLHPEYRRFYRGNRGMLAVILLILGDHGAASSVAEVVAKAGVDRIGDPHIAASYLARCMPLAVKDSKLDEAERKDRVQQYGDRAMQLLRQAVQNGFQDLQQMNKDRRFDPLRSRPDERRRRPINLVIHAIFRRRQP